VTTDEMYQAPAGNGGAWRSRGAEVTDVRDTNPSRGIDTLRDTDAPRDTDTPRDTDAPRVIDTPRDINAPRVINAAQDIHTPRDINALRDMTAVRRTGVANPLRSLHLHSRPHIDLQRVAGALCCS
jgi:hypothetical protein